MTPDGRYLFFTSRRMNGHGPERQGLKFADLMRVLGGPTNGNGDLYWVDFAVVERLRAR